MAPFIKALFFVLAVVYALQLPTQVKGERDFTGLQGTKGASTMEEYDHRAKAEEIHARMFEAAVEEYQLHTNKLADKNVKEGIAKALKEYHVKAAKLAEAKPERESSEPLEKKETSLTKKEEQQAKSEVIRTELLKDVVEDYEVHANNLKDKGIDAKLFKDAVELYEHKTNKVPTKEVKDGIKKALKEYHTKAFAQEVEAHASKTAGLTDGKSDVDCNSNDQTVQYNGKNYDAASDKTSFDFGFSNGNNNDPNNNGQDNSNNNNGYSGNDSGNNGGNNNNPYPYNSATPAKSACAAQKVPAYQRTVALFVFAYAFLKWTEEDRI